MASICCAPGEFGGDSNPILAFEEITRPPVLSIVSKRQVRTAGFVSTIVPDNAVLRRNVCPGEKLNYV